MVCGRARQRQSAWGWPEHQPLDCEVVSGAGTETWWGYYRVLLYTIDKNVETFNKIVYTRAIHYPFLLASTFCVCIYVNKMPLRGTRDIRVIFGNLTTRLTFCLLDQLLGFIYLKKTRFRHVFKFVECYKNTWYAASDMQKHRVCSWLWHNTRKCRLWMPHSIKANF